MAVLIAVLFIGAVSLAVVGYTRTVRRDSRSVEAYKETVGHLQHVTGYDLEDRMPLGRPGAAHVRILTKDGAPPAERPMVARAAPAPVGPPPVAPVPASPVPTSSLPWAELSGAGKSSRARPDPIARLGRVLARSGGRGRSWVPSGLGLGWLRVALPVVGVVGVVALIAGLTAGPAHHIAALRSHTGVSNSGRATLPSSPPTTAAPAPQLLTASSTADAAVYTVHSGPIAVSLTTAGRCWVELRSASATGPLLFEGVLSPGAQKAFADLTGVWLRLGYPAGVTIHVNGASISIPANSSPFNITVEEAASSPAA